jgi:hypothetical protein
MVERQVHGAQDVDTMAAAANPARANIREEWAWVKQGIKEILAEQPQLTFIPEDVYAACLNQEAHLWVAPEGFVITTAERDEFTGARTFLLWLAWAKNRGQSCAIRYLPFFTQLARDSGFKTLEVPEHRYQL